MPPPQADLSEKLRGPPANRAFDAEGAPTKALEGFCRKNGVDPADVIREADAKGTEYCVAVVEKKVPSADLAPRQSRAYIGIRHVL